VQVGELIEYQGRVMRVDEIFGPEGRAYVIVAECLEPEDKDKKWWTIDVVEGVAGITKITRH
jgi:hypothetical protein